MPLQETFWAERFGMLTDRYGTSWAINGGPKPMQTRYSGRVAPEPPISFGMSLNLGRPSLIRSLVSS